MHMINKLTGLTELKLFTYHTGATEITPFLWRGSYYNNCWVRIYSIIFVKQDNYKVYWPFPSILLIQFINLPNILLIKFINQSKHLSQEMYWPSKHLFYNVYWPSKHLVYKVYWPSKHLGQSLSSLGTLKKPLALSGTEPSCSELRSIVCRQLTFFDNCK